MNNTQFITLLILILGGMLVQFVGFLLLSSRIGDLSTRIEMVCSDLTSRIDRIGTELTARIDRIGTELTARIDRIADDLKRSRAA